MRAIVVDDEPLTGEHIGRLLTEAGVNVLECCADPRQVPEMVDSLRPDVLFLDIEMPEMSGLSLAEHIYAGGSKTEIVFITAYRQYAIEAFRVNAQDYLLKPVMEEDLHRSLERIRRRLVHLPDRPESKRKSRVEASLFGHFALRLDGSPTPIRWKTSKCEELLVYMLLQREDAEVSKWTLIEALWKEKNIEKAEINLRSTISRLNKTLRENGLSMALVSVKNGYRLNRADTELSADAYLVERCALESVEIGIDNAERIEALLERCERPFLEKFGSEWCESYRYRYHRDLMNLGRKLLAYYERNEAEPFKRLRLTELLLRHEPYADAIRVLALRLHERVGGRTQALAYYRQYAALLERDLGTEPGDELKAIYRNLVHS
ncbi:response regulator [Paenibacillaceae bacterium WGS1546]|uniref:response regulator n=1 Tax=Cohnella sp. WGS1546 TaxID=3366810 RepID=UPI00372D68DE